MVKIKALRGVCLGVDRHLQPGEAGEVDAATAKWLVHINAVEIIVEAPAQEEPAPAQAPEPPAPVITPGPQDSEAKGQSEEKDKRKK